MQSPEPSPAFDSARPEGADQPEAAVQTANPASVETPDAASDPSDAGQARRRRRTRRRILAASLVVVLLVALGPIAWVQISGQTKVRSGASDVPHRSVALVFGAGLRADGTPSPYLTRRLDMARQLFEAGTVDVILVSGDNSSAEYDEPTAMITWLTDAGVPAERVVADYAGFDTHDTCVRAKEIFGVDDAVLVTQDYHIRRALFSCSAAGIDVVGVGVSSETASTTKVVGYQVREVAASWRAALDGLTGRSPVHLGTPETGVRDALDEARAADE